MYLRRNIMLMRRHGFGAALIAGIRYWSIGELNTPQSPASHDSPASSGSPATVLRNLALETAATCEFVRLPLSDTHLRRVKHPSATVFRCSILIVLVNLGKVIEEPEDPFNVNFLPAGKLKLAGFGHDPV